MSIHPIDRTAATMVRGSRKRARARDRASPGGGGGDRLSALPDALLHSIMSFLMARQAVQTSVLSRRWRDLWRSMPDMYIDDEEFGFADMGSEYEDSFGGRIGYYYSDAYQCDYDDNWEKLHDFTANLLMFHDAPVLDKFRLHIQEPERRYHADIDRWIRRGIEYRPAVLDITTGYEGTRHRGFELPPLGSSNCTSRLKRLHLCGLSLGTSFAESLQSGCPVLEHLELRLCCCDFSEMISGTLRSLSLYSCDPMPPTVAAPALASFRLDFATMAYLPVPSSSPFGDNVFNLLGSVCNVTTIYLSGFYPASEDPAKKFPKLNNLTTLSLEKCDMSQQFKILRLCLENAPSLEKVTLQHCKDSDGRSRRSREGEDLSRCNKLISFESPEKKLIEIKYKDRNTRKLFKLLMGIWRKLKSNTIVLTKI